MYLQYFFFNTLFWCEVIHEPIQTCHNRHRCSGKHCLDSFHSLLHQLFTTDICFIEQKILCRIQISIVVQESVFFIYLFCFCLTGTGDDLVFTAIANCIHHMRFLGIHTSAYTDHSCIFFLIFTEFFKLCKFF